MKIKQFKKSMLGWGSLGFAVLVHQVAFSYLGDGWSKWTAITVFSVPLIAYLYKNKKHFEIFKKLITAFGYFYFAVLVIKVLDYLQNADFMKGLGIMFKFAFSNS